MRTKVDVDNLRQRYGFELPRNRSSDTLGAGEIRSDIKTERVLQALQVEYAQIEKNTTNFR